MAVHGTPGKYNKGCRCGSCKAAKAAHGVALHRKAVVNGLHPLDPRHGTANAYKNFGCRCDKCKAAKAASRRAVA